MCGIVGYVGDKKAAPILLKGLEKLEYRGYDSAGLAVRNGEKEPEVVKAKGYLKTLAEKTDYGKSLKGNCGIGHTRWATHGEPSEDNAHPHITDNYSIVGVHNGIIENFRELKNKMIRKGYTFYSDTDTEVAIKTIDYYYNKYTHDPIEALAKTMVRVRGSYALAVMFKDHPGKIFVARKDSPMIVGVTEKAAFVASDVPAILNYTRNIYYVDNLEMACLSAGEAVFYNLDGDVVEKEVKFIDWDSKAAEKGGFEHFMLKEIYEQPQTTKDTINSLVKSLGKDGKYEVDLGDTNINEDLIKNLRQIYIVACGSSYHVGIDAQYVIEDLTGIPVRVELASEFRYRKTTLVKDSLVIFISQSGETADTLAALRLVKDNNIPTLAIVNVIGSSIAREADNVIYTVTGPEIAVATTKAYSAQLSCCYILATHFGNIIGNIDEDRKNELLEEICSIPDKIARILEDKERLQWFAAKLTASDDIFFIGRGIDYAVGLEGSLKMKEISYIHSEAYAAGELKHGTISLIEEGTPVVGILTQDALYEKTVSNMDEVKARGAYLVGITSFGNYSMEDHVNFAIYVPKIDNLFSASLTVVPLQLLAYYVSIARGLDPDKPRNLAKSVTVE